MISILVGAILSLLMNEFLRASPRLVDRLIARAVRNQPPQFQSRYREEWAAEIDHMRRCSGELTILLWAVRVFVTSFRLAAIHETELLQVLRRDVLTLLEDLGTIRADLVIPHDISDPPPPRDDPSEFHYRRILKWRAYSYSRADKLRMFELMVTGRRYKERFTSRVNELARRLQAAGIHCEQLVEFNSRSAGSCGGGFIHLNLRPILQKIVTDLGQRSVSPRRA